MRSLLTNRRFACFWAGQTLSRLGDASFAIALSWLILDLTNSPVAVGTAMLLMTLPAILLAPVGGALLDRLDLKRLMLFTDWASFVLTGGLWLLQALGHLELWHVYTFALLFGAVQAIFLPIYLSAMPRLVAPEQLQAANSLFAGSMEVSGIAGPALAGALIAAFGTGSAIGVNALSFVASGLCMLAMPGALPGGASPGSAGRNADRCTEASHRPSLLREIAAVFPYLRREPIALGLLLLRGLGNLGLAPFEVLLAVWVRQALQGGPEVLGLLTTAMSVGALAGSLLGLPRRPWSSGQLIIAANVVLGGLIALFVATPWLPVLLVLAPLIGYLLAAEQVLVDLLFQRIIDPGVLGRMSSMRVLVSLSLRSAGQGVCGWISLAIGAGPTIAVGGGVVALAALVVRRWTPIRSSN